MKSLILLPIAFTGQALADFYFGSISGEQNSGSVHNPSQLPYCDYLIVANGASICTASTFTPANGSGGCPGQNGNAPDFCGLDTGVCPSGWQLDTTGDCGAADQATQGSSSGVPNGQFYANLIDTTNNNAFMGRCVYEYNGNTNCAEGFGLGIAETFIHCYTTMYGTTQC